jgi:ABC-2 type transport system ATP-binding protein
MINWQVLNDFWSFGLMKYAIETQGLIKKFGDFVAVNDVNLQVPVGSVYGYLGANGAGKTTTIRMLLGLLAASGGTVSVLNHPVPKEFNAVRRRLGVVPGEIRLYEELTGREFLDYFQCFECKEPKLQKQLLSDFKLPEKDLDKRIRHYSHGMKQKILLIQAMQNNPELLILDEPSERLDPLIQHKLYQYINQFKSEGKTIFFSSHNLPEVEKICDYIAIIKDGKLLVQDRIDSLKNRLERKIVIQFAKPVDPKIFNSNKYKVLNHSENEITISIKGPLNELMEQLKKYDVYDVTFPESSLESYFMKYYMNGINNGEE